ncbi:MAG: DUF4159 domain-containing protein [Gemmatimonadota bacterium]
MSARRAIGVALLALPLLPAPFARAQAPAGFEAEPPSTSLTIARLRYGPGDWYANPTSLPNLLRFLREELGFPTAEREAVVRATDPGLDRYPLLYLTGHGEIRLTGEEVDALRQYLTSGGMLHTDDNFGIDETLRREIARIFPEEPLVELPVGHPVYRVAFRFPDGIPKVHEHAGGPPRAFGVFHDGRLAIFYSFNTDLGDGWEDPAVHGDPEPVRRRALEMGANVFTYALTH